MSKWTKDDRPKIFLLGPSPSQELCLQIALNVLRPYSRYLAILKEMCMCESGMYTELMSNQRESSIEARAAAID